MSDIELKFSVDSLLLSELGERLVTKSYIALAELVKNAYDADATEIKISFNHARSGPGEKSEISIADNGHGMTFEQIRDYWMVIATPNKIRNPISPVFGRKKTGDKGIGRFACRRLADKLVLESISRSTESKDFEYTKVIFDWNKFQPGLLLTEVPNTYEKRRLTEGKCGLTLGLIGLKEYWNQRDFNTLRRQILGLSLVSGTRRSGFKEDAGFNIIFDAPEFEMGTGSMAEQVMDAGWGRLKGEIKSNGTAVLNLEALKIGKVEFELPEPFEKIAGVSYDIAIIWDRKEYCRDPSVFALYVVDEILRQYSGIKVFLDGFRVYPYGDPGDDWLDIDKDVARRLTKASDIFLKVAENLMGVKHSRALLNHPRNSNLIGRVQVSSYPKRLFEVTTSREGFIQSESLDQLKSFIRRGIEWATLYYNHFLYKLDEEDALIRAKRFKETVAELKGEIGKPIPEAPNVPLIESALNFIDDAVTTATSKERKVSDDEQLKLLEHVGSAVHVVKESVYRMERQTDLLRTVASSGALMLTFVHEARDVIGKLDTHANELASLATKLDDPDKQKFIELSGKLKKTRDRFDNQVRLILGISRGLTETQRRRIRIRRTLDEVVSAFQGMLDRFGISLEADVSDSLRTRPMLDSEVYSILINVVSNAVKAVIASENGHRIRVEGSGTADGTFLRVYDDGIGLSKESKRLVGTPLIADPDGRLYKRLRERVGYGDLIVVGEGSGMGLSIVRDILKQYDKDFQFVDVKSPWKTCVEVRLP